MVEQIGGNFDDANQGNQAEEEDSKDAEVDSINDQESGVYRYRMCWRKIII